MEVRRASSTFSEESDIGKKGGRSTITITFLYSDLYIVVESVGLIGDSDAWTTDDQCRLKTTWFREMLRWLIETPFGKDANMKRNNHGTW